MLFNSARMSFNIILLVLLGIYNRVDIIMAHQCYVCGTKANISCDKFDPTNKSFIKDCPSAKGCTIETHGNSVERSCGEDTAFRDCQTANNIQYCYCLKSLCNGKTISFSDDEDLTEEGSGTTVINTIENDIKSNITSQSNHIQFYLYSTCISILVLLCN